MRTMTCHCSSPLASGSMERKEGRWSDTIDSYSPLSNALSPHRRFDLSSSSSVSDFPKSSGFYSASRVEIGLDEVRKCWAVINQRQGLRC